MRAVKNRRYRLELADVLKSCRQELKSRYKLGANQLKAMNDIIDCRTIELGGHKSLCNQCGHKEQSYNSCRNRHCPKCQFIKQEQWVDRLKGRLIPGRYFHVVFTIPAQLHPLFYMNQEKCYGALMQSAWQALQKAGRNPSFLGADIGAVSVLHTWGQTLVYHPHVHMLVPAGGISEDEMEWIPSFNKFFVPVKAVSSMFRGILTKQLEKLVLKKHMKLPEEFKGFDQLKKELYRKNWNVYSKKAFGGMNSVLKYLGKYTHRVAISNHRLNSSKNGRINFSYRDYRKGRKDSVMELSELEFARRFLQHILPSGFYKIRYMGILATVHMQTKREQSIRLVGKSILIPKLEGLSAYEMLRVLSGKDPASCPVCKKGIMVRQRGVVQTE